MHVLVVDDEPYVRSLLSEMIKDLGHDVEDCEDVPSAQRRLDAASFDVVFSDVRMPDVDGLEFLERSQERPEAFVMITGLADFDTAVQALRLGAADFVTKPFDRKTIHASVRRAGRVVAERRFPRKVGLDGEPVSRIFRNGMPTHLEKTIHSLVTALDARESETNNHSIRVSLYALKLARELGKPEPICEAIRLGGLLHDVGKIGVPDSILLKKGPLTVEEWAAMKRHPLVGLEITRSLDLDPQCHDVVVSHHERFNGLGYPFGLSGHEIPESARIFAIADALDAITSDRPYRAKRSFSQAAIEIFDCSGSHFDPEFVKAFVQVPESVWVEIREQASRN